VSIVTVTLNNRAFIEEAMQSVFVQSYPGIEYVVIDGGSTDGTADIVKAHQKRLAGWTSEPDLGIADAFNKGLARTTGDYVLFLNSDDRFASSNSVDLLARAALRFDLPDIVCGACRLVDRESGRLVRHLSVRMTRLGLMVGRISPHPAMLTSRAYFGKFGVFDSSFKIAMDLDLMLRGARQSRVAYVPDVITVMRSGGASLRRRASVVEEILRALRKNGLVRSHLGERLIRAYFAVGGTLGPRLRALGEWMRRG
jgi:glycosyltransferase